MNKFFLICACLVTVTGMTTIHAAPVSGQGSWETTLQGRDLDGNAATFEAYYDTVLDITWLADANAAGTSMNWADANAWASNLNVSGISGWRLPTLAPIDGVAFDYNSSFDGTTDRAYNISAPGTAYAGSTASEMAHLFFNTLGNLAFADTGGNNPQSGFGLTNTGPFSNFQSAVYWSELQYAPEITYAWYFNFFQGNQLAISKDQSNYALAVRDGDISAVPVPAAVWLFGSGLFGLLGLAKRKAIPI